MQGMAPGGHAGRNVLLILSLLLSFTSRSAEPALTAQQTTFFEQKIRPTLAKHCYECHSEEAGKRKGGLVLDSKEGLLRGGDSGPAIVSGDPAKSRLIHAVKHATDDLQMPPEGKLSAEEISALEQWIQQGAPDPRSSVAKGEYRKGTADHWAFKELKRPAAPKVKNKKWATSAIDQFILSSLEERKLEPSKRADKATLLRRVTFDLTGLPPSPADLDAFLSDNSEGAFAKVVDRLLESPRFGERWGRHWLDVARYADSNGLEANVPYTNAWRYRDYVISSFNQDKPFNRFLVEQIAGDLLPAANDPEYYTNLIATGFLMLGPKPAAQDREKLALDVADEQIDVTTKAFLGLTVSCARCHDHKFDPIPTRDYYALAGIFLSTRTLGDGANGPLAANQRPIAERAIAEKYEAHQRLIAQERERLQQLRDARRNLPGGIDSKKLAGVTVDNKAAELTGPWKVSNYSTNFVDQDYLHDGDSNKGKLSAKFVPDLPSPGFYEVRIAYTPRLNRATNVPITIQTVKGPVVMKLNQRIEPKYNKAFIAIGDYEFPAGTNGSVTISNEGTKGFVVADAVQFVPVYENMMAGGMMAADANMMAGPNFNAAFGQFSPEEVAAAKRIRDLEVEMPPALPVTMAPSEGLITNAAIRIRGEVQRVGEVVPRGVIKVLEKPELPIPQFDNETSGRRQLAEWMAHPRNPLTARVYANRVWSKLMGRGLVDTVDNFGFVGEPPTHPELLDELSTQLIESGWSTKKLIRQIVLSAAYQQSSESDPRFYTKDPDNKFYWRAHRKRLEAEAVRDAILMVAQRLKLEPMGGPASEALNFNALNPDLPETAFDNARRSVYLPVVRNNIPDFFQVLDFPDPHIVNGKRHVTVAAPQALFFMNSPFILNQAREWGRALAEAKLAGVDLARTAYRAAYGRNASDGEAQRAAQFIAQQEQHFTKAGEREGKSKAVQAFCQAIFASSEFRMIN
ncbi:MAG TPA: DUF1549 domain-containing protein [Methylomirabilota bacterium]|nr:DUF1549 domain-containing protein [Methylomirabilota bacterium]